jgi:hypothetical protein
MEFKVATPKKILLGTETVNMVDGQKLNVRIKLEEEWVDLLDEKVPNGKTWEVDFFIRAAENDI